LQPFFTALLLSPMLIFIARILKPFLATVSVCYSWNLWTHFESISCSIFFRFN